MITTSLLLATGASFVSSVDWGLFFAAIGFALAVLLPGIGSSIGVHLAGCAAAGVLAEDPGKFGKLILLEALPGTQGIYGLLIGFIFLLKLGLFGGNFIVPTAAEGLYMMAASFPMAFVGFWSAIYQGRVAAAGVALVAKRETESGKALTLAAMVETYAVLALLMSFLSIFFFNIKGVA
jgi:V/A-type H+-transporting ATPase subunit K